MRAVVLVGGFGTRLRPLTTRTPKPMLPVGHRPMIEVVVDQLARGGVTDVVLALGFAPEPFRQGFPDGFCAGLPLTYAVEPEPLDTAGAVRFAARFAEIDETFLVVNGDILTDVDVSTLVDFHRRHGAEATLHLTSVPDPSQFGVVVVDPATGLVDRFVEKPAPGTAPSNLINAGLYVFEPSVLDRIPDGRKVSVERETFPAMVADRRLYAMPTDDYWLDTGRPHLYIQANLDAVAGMRKYQRCNPVGDGADVAADAVIDGSLIGAGSIVGAGARLERSVLLPGAVVEAGATLVDSVVAGRVGGSARLEGCVIGSDGIVGAGVSLVDARVPAPDA
jgi:mannose-1-phosphate guanylyltransferase